MLFSQTDLTERGGLYFVFVLLALACVWLAYFFIHLVVNHGDE